VTFEVSTFRLKILQTDVPFFFPGSVGAAAADYVVNIRIIDAYNRFSVNTLTLTLQFNPCPNFRNCYN